MHRIAIVESGYVRDAQVFVKDPASLNDEDDWDDGFDDYDIPVLYLGIFSGADENTIRNAVAKRCGLHPNVISLINFIAGGINVI